MTAHVAPGPGTALGLAADPGRPLADRLGTALADPTGAALEELADEAVLDRRDRFRALLTVYDLWTAPLHVVGPAVRHQGHPALVALKRRLESDWLVELDQAWDDAGHLGAAADDADDAVRQVVSAMRAVAAKDRLPPVYRWLAGQASWSELVAFLTLEGGPDGGFDDLVALCQVGLSGSAKLELGKNYWDEMGRGNAGEVHTVLHERMAAAIGIAPVPREQQPVEALERAALGGLLATNRWLQPEMVGALGLLELQAGPRCRLVVQAFDRLGAPAAAYPFYVDHADLDPVHGKDWMDKVVVPLVTAHPEWGPRIVKGAWWRSTVNLSFFEALHRELVARRSAA